MASTRTVLTCSLSAVMNSNEVHPSANPPAYSDHLPPAEPAASDVYAQQSMQQVQPDAGPGPQSAWNGPNVSQYPPAAYPPPAGPGPYGQPYPPPGYAASAAHPEQQQQQQQQVVVVTGGHQPQPMIMHQHETFIGHMILACFVLWCCNCLFGLVAFILAGQLNSFSSHIQFIFCFKNSIYSQNIFL